MKKNSKSNAIWTKLVAVLVFSMLILSAVPIVLGEEIQDSDLDSNLESAEDNLEIAESNPSNPVDANSNEQGILQAPPKLPRNNFRNENLNEMIRERVEKISSMPPNEAREKIMAECMKTCLQKLKDSEQALSEEALPEQRKKFGLICNEKCIGKPENKEKRMEKMQELKQEKSVKQAKISIDELKGILSELKPSKRENKRLIEDSEIVKMDKAISRSKEKYQEAKQSHVAKRKSIEDLKADYKNCIKQYKSEESAAAETEAAETGTLEDSVSEGEKKEIKVCREIKNRFNADARVFLVNTADLLVESLNKLKYQVKISSDISEEEATKIIENIDAEITAVKNARVAIEKLDENSKPAELQEQAKIINNSWKKVRLLIKEKVNCLIGAKLGNIIQRMEQLEAKFTKTKEKLKEKGADVSELDSYLIEYNSNLQSAKESYNKALELFKNAEGNDGAEEKNQAQELLKKSREEISNANKSLMKVFREIKKQLAQLNAESSEETGKTTETLPIEETPESPAEETAAESVQPAESAESAQEAVI